MNFPRHRKGKSDNTFCCVPQCNSKGSRDPSLSFHAFPHAVESDRIRRKKWILACRIGKTVSRRMCICSRHFKDSDYFLKGYPAQRPRLKRTAIPSLNLPRTNEPRPKSPVKCYRETSFRKEESSADESVTQSPLHDDQSFDQIDPVTTEKTESSTSLAESLQTTIRISNLPEETYHSDLYKLFGSFGQVDKIYIVKTSPSGKCQGLAFIHYLDHEQASRAFLLDGHTFGTNVLKVEWAKKLEGK